MLITEKINSWLFLFDFVFLKYKCKLLNRKIVLKYNLRADRLGKTKKSL